MITVVLVDDHEVVVQGLRLLLGELSDVEVVGSANDGDAGIRLVQELRPDVVLMDLSMPGTDGVAATQRINQTVPDVAVVVLTTFADRDRVLASLDAGAVGYLMKDVSPQSLQDGVRAAACGGSPIDPRVARTLVDARRQGESASPQRLTAKQLEVVRLVDELAGDDTSVLAWVRAELQDLKELPAELAGQAPTRLDADGLRELLADA